MPVLPLLVVGQSKTTQEPVVLWFAPEFDLDQPTRTSPFLGIDSFLNQFSSAASSVWVRSSGTRSDLSQWSFGLLRSSTLISLRALVHSSALTASSISFPARQARSGSDRLAHVPPQFPFVVGRDRCTDEGPAGVDASRLNPDDDEC